MSLRRCNSVERCLKITKVRKEQHPHKKVLKGVLQAVKTLKVLVETTFQISGNQRLS